METGRATSEQGSVRQGRQGMSGKSQDRTRIGKSRGDQGNVGTGNRDQDREGKGYIHSIVSVRPSKAKTVSTQRMNRTGTNAGEANSYIGLGQGGLSKSRGRVGAIL